MRCTGKACERGYDRILGGVVSFLSVCFCRAGVPICVMLMGPWMARGTRVPRAVFVGEYKPRSPSRTATPTGEGSDVYRVGSR